MTGTAFNTLLLTQHKDYPKVRWVICSICQQEDPEKAKREVPISGVTFVQFLLKEEVKVQYNNDMCKIIDDYCIKSIFKYIVMKYII